MQGPVHILHNSCYTWTINPCYIWSIVNSCYIWIIINSLYSLPLQTSTMSTAIILSLSPSTQPFHVLSQLCLLMPPVQSTETLNFILLTLIFLSLLTSRSFQTWSSCSGLIATDCHSKSCQLTSPHSTELHPISTG